MDGAVEINTAGSVAPLRNVMLLNALINRVQHRDDDLQSPLRRGLASRFGPVRI